MPTMSRKARQASAASRGTSGCATARFHCRSVRAVPLEKDGRGPGCAAHSAAMARAVSGSGGCLQSSAGDADRAARFQVVEAACRMTMNGACFFTTIGGM